MSKRKKFEELTQEQKYAFHNMDKRTLFRLHSAQMQIVRAGLCKPKLEVCAGCPIKKMTGKEVGWGGPMACSLIQLEAVSKGRYTPVKALEDMPCDQCAKTILAGEMYVPVLQMGYRTLRFCLKCVEAQQ